MKKFPRVLIVEDEPAIAELIAIHLRHAGHEVTQAGTVAQARAALDAVLPDLVVLDWMLPGGSGVELARHWRAAARTRELPILMLTARGDDMDRILGLEMGADDYLTKPFVPRELFARIRAVLRRTRSLPPNLDTAAPSNARELHFAQWRLDTVNRHLIDADGTVVALSGAEYRMLTIFLSHPQRVLSRDQLMELTQGREAELFDRSIDLQVSRLRQRLGDNAREPTIIKTIRNEGYVLAVEVSTVAPDSTRNSP